MSDKKIIDVESKANDVLSKYNPDGNSPFPFKKIVDGEEGLEVSFLELDNEISGAIKYDKNIKKFSIFINKNKPPRRQYFTLGHELGHYFLHREIIEQEEIFVDADTTEIKTLYRLDATAMTEIEKQANNFAAYLLMPTNLVIKAWKSIGNIEECSNLFYVSIIAMSIRLEKLGLLNHEQ